MINSLGSIAAGLALTAVAAPAWSYCTTFGATTLNTCFGLTADAQGQVAGNALGAKAEFLTNKSSIGTLNFSQYPLATANPFAVATPADQPANFRSGANTVNQGAFSQSGAAGPFVAQDLFDPQDDGQTLRALGRFNTSPGADDPEGMILESGAGFTITFDQAVQAFGFYGTDIGDFGGSLTLELYVTGEEAAPSQTLTVFQANTPTASADPAGGSLLFFGFFDSAKSYKKVSFVQSSAFDGFGYDDMVVAALTDVPPPNPTPEPAGLALLGAAFAAAALARRRTRRTD